jgi:hypothetical protein
MGNAIVGVTGMIIISMSIGYIYGTPFGWLTLGSLIFLDALTANMSWRN